MDLTKVQVHEEQLSIFRLDYQWNENCEEKLPSFIYNELKIDSHIEIGNVHRFGKRGLNGAQPIVARFIYRQDLENILKNAYRLKGKRFSINEQFPYEIEKQRKMLYPVMKKAKQDGSKARLVRDKLYINGKLYKMRNKRYNEKGIPRK